MQVLSSGHELPHTPQFPFDVFRFASQPFATLRSQFAVPAPHSPQTRFVVAVGGTVSCCAAVHTVSAVQTRLLVAVGAVDSNCVAVHTVSAVQTRLLVAVGAVV